MKKILVAVDGSDASLRGARLALELAQATGAQLTAAFCLSPPVIAGEIPFMLISEVVNADLARDKEVLKDVVKQLNSPDILPLLLEGPPAERLAEGAERDDFDLVVVGQPGSPCGHPRLVGLGGRPARAHLQEARACRALSENSGHRGCLNAASMKTPGPDGDVVVQLPIRVRRTEYGQGESTEAYSVACPIAGGDVPLRHCESCARAQAILGEPGERVLQCRVPAMLTTELPKGADLHEKLKRTKVSEVMTKAVTCVDSELDLAELSKLLQTLGLRGVPVVEDEGVILGMVSLTDLVRGSREKAKDNQYPPDCAGLLVEDIMSGEVVTLQETSSVAEAMELMLKKKLHRVAVVAHNDVVVGILSLVDLARWIAREDVSP